MTPLILSPCSFVMFVALQIVVSSAQVVVADLQFDFSAEDSEGFIATLVEWNDMLQEVKNVMRKRHKDTDFEGGLEEYRNEVRKIRKRIGGILQKAEATPTDTSPDYTIIRPIESERYVQVDIEMIKHVRDKHISAIDDRIKERDDLVASLNRTLNTEREEFNEAVDKCQFDLHQTLTHWTNEVGHAQEELISKAIAHDYYYGLEDIHMIVDRIQSLYKQMFMYFDMNELISPFEVADLVNKRKEQSKTAKAVLISIEQSLQELKENDVNRNYFRQAIATLSKDLNVRDCAGLSLYNPRIDLIFNTLPVDLEKASTPLDFAADFPCTLWSEMILASVYYSKILCDETMKAYRDQIEKIDKLDADIASTYFTIRTLELVIDKVENGVKDTVIWNRTEPPKLNWVPIYHVLKHFVEKDCEERQAALRQCILRQTQSI